MRVLFYDAHHYERDVFDREFQSSGHTLSYVEPRLTSETADLAKGFDAVCSFVNDRVDRATLQKLSQSGVKAIALRCAGFNHVDLKAAQEFGIPVVRVPAYSPHAVAEHAVALLLTLNRKIHRSHARIRELNFSLEGLVGFDLFQKTVGVIGTGNIGTVLAKIFRGFGCRVLAHDRNKNPELANDPGVQYVDLQTLYRESDVISLHVPLNEGTRHLINAESLALMKPHVLLINTGRGGLVDSTALIQALKKHTIGGAGLDVYEEEEGVFFHDLSSEGIGDDVLARLLTFPNVVITSHQAFLTQEALSQIARTTRDNLSAVEKRSDASKALPNQVSVF
jgi:D-lactate dehydrogenase